MNFRCRLSQLSTSRSVLVSVATRALISSTRALAHTHFREFAQAVPTGIAWSCSTQCLGSESTRHLDAAGRHEAGRACMNVIHAVIHAASEKKQENGAPHLYTSHAELRIPEQVATSLNRKRATAKRAEIEEHMLVARLSEARRPECSKLQLRITWPDTVFNKEEIATMPSQTQRQPSAIWCTGGNPVHFVQRIVSKSGRLRPRHTGHTGPQGQGT